MFNSESAKQNHEGQVVYYHPGVGTEAPPGFVTGFGKKLAKLAGLAFGYGLKRDVANAYIFIIDNYKPGDRLFIFGFSRG
ncbi:phospholipase effector Tle1 domain-containing protein, partial [Rhizobium ruizarguesonis]